MKVKYIVLGLIIIGISALVIYRISKNKEESAVPGAGKGGAGGGKSQPPMRVNGMVVVAAPFTNSLSVSGSIEANEQVQLRSQFSGIVNKIYFKEGAMVKKGQVLFKIDDSELRAQLGEANTKQGLAKENERRAKLLLEKEAIGREEYEVSLAAFKALQAQTQLINAQLAKTTVEAPFTGRIGLRNVSEGEYLTPTTIVANLVSTNPVKITFSVPEKYSGQVRLQSELTFTVSGSEIIYKAKVYAIEPTIDAETRTLQLRATADNESGSLIPGSFANVALPLATVNDAILIPTEAIVPIQNGKKVFISENGKAKEVIIETSTRTEKDVLVTAGLKSGDTVITTGVMSLKKEAPVKVMVKGNKK